jgi:hypothetical protein
MSIEVVCPNGHTLKVKDSLAGKKGLCPVCKTQVNVPPASDAPSGAQLTEDAILGILGPHEPDPGRSQAPIEDPMPARGATGVNLDPTRAPPNKSCDKCNMEIPAGTVICPHCRTYIAGLTDLTK